MTRKTKIKLNYRGGNPDMKKIIPIVTSFTEAIKKHET